MKTNIKEFRTMNGDLIEELFFEDDLIPIEIIYKDGSREINCTPFPLTEPRRFYTNHAAVVHRMWRERKDKKFNFLKGFESTYSTDYPRKYWERKIALTMKDRGQENKRFAINGDSIKPTSDLIRFAMPSMCSASFKSDKEWLRNKEQWNRKVKINAEILKDGRIEKSF